MTVLKFLVETVEATGGVFRDNKGLLRPYGDDTWIDIAEAYVKACEVLARSPIIDENYPND